MFHCIVMSMCVLVLFNCNFWIFFPFFFAFILDLGPYFCCTNPNPSILTEPWTLTIITTLTLTLGQRQLLYANASKTFLLFASIPKIFLLYTMESNASNPNPKFLALTLNPKPYTCTKKPNPNKIIEPYY